MDLSTTYLGLQLRSPLVVSSSPLSRDIDNIKKMEDLGAAAVVLHSLFEEQLKDEAEELEQRLSEGTNSFAEAVSFFPQAGTYHLGPQEYLAHLRRAKAAVQIPIIASLNGSSAGGWTDYAKHLQEAGADALELNIYAIPTDLDLTGAEVENTYLDILEAVRSVVSIPVAVKLSPFFSNMANMARRLDQAGVRGLVLFNRFYQPDIDVEALEVQARVLWSTPFAQRLPMRWIAILAGNIEADLAATSGIHTAEDVIKMLMAGARVTMLYSALARHGLTHLRTVEGELADWLHSHEYPSVKSIIGTMSQKKIRNPSAFERAQFVKAIHAHPSA
jgi:dihydroorotate dehydrogenase (fumarate)